MAYRKVNDFTLGVKIGDTGYSFKSLVDYQIHPQFQSQSSMEAFVNALNPLLDGKIYHMNCNVGSYYDEAFVVPNDTGSAMSKTYTISFKDVPMTCKFEVPFVNPLKIKEVGQVLKTLDFYIKETKLVIKAVKVSM